MGELLCSPSSPFPPAPDSPKGSAAGPRDRKSVIRDKRRRAGMERRRPALAAMAEAGKTSAMSDTRHMDLDRVRAAERRAFWWACRFAWLSLIALLGDCRPLHRHGVHPRRPDRSALLRLGDGRVQHHCHGPVPAGHDGTGCPLPHGAGALAVLPALPPGRLCRLCRRAHHRHGAHPRRCVGRCLRAGL